MYQFVIVLNKFFLEAFCTGLEFKAGLETALNFRTLKKTALNCPEK